MQVSLLPGILIYVYDQLIHNRSTIKLSLNYRSIGATKAGAWCLSRGVP